MALAKYERLAIVLPEGAFFDRAFTELRSLCEKLAVAATRVPVQFSAGNRLGEACSLMESADLVLVDITARNPHTLYLAGYAHGTGKHILFLSQHGEDLPFDRSRHRFVIYHANLDLLEKGVETFLLTGDAPSPVGAESSSPPVTPEAIDAKARFQTIFGDIMTEHQAEHPALGRA